MRIQLVSKNQSTREVDDDDHSFDLEYSPRGDDHSSADDDSFSQLFGDSKNSFCSPTINSSKHSNSSFGSSFSSFQHSKSKLRGSVKQRVKNSNFLPNFSGLGGFSAHTQKRYAELKPYLPADRSTAPEKTQEIGTAIEGPGVLNESGHTGTTSSESHDNSFAEEDDVNVDSSNQIKAVKVCAHSQTRKKSTEIDPRKGCAQIGENATWTDKHFESIYWVRQCGNQCFQLNIPKKLLKPTTRPHAYTLPAGMPKMDPAAANPSKGEPPRGESPRTVEPVQAPTTPRRPSAASTQRTIRRSQSHLVERRALNQSRRILQESLEDVTSEHLMSGTSVRTSHRQRTDVDTPRHVRSPRRRADPSVVLGRITPRLDRSRRCFERSNTDLGDTASIPRRDAESGRISPPRIRIVRERVNFDFNPRDLTGLASAIEKSKREKSATPKTPKIIKPLVDKFHRSEREAKETMPQNIRGTFSIPRL